MHNLFVSKDSVGLVYLQFLIFNGVLQIFQEE